VLRAGVKKLVSGQESRVQPGCRKIAKKTKDKAFARSVSRQDIIAGAEQLGVPLEEHVAFCIKAMQARAVELGLAGNPAASG
jgi:predicted hydrolase (HD superfamily)